MSRRVETPPKVAIGSLAVGAIRIDSRRPSGYPQGFLEAPVTVSKGQRRLIRDPIGGVLPTHGVRAKPRPLPGARVLPSMRHGDALGLLSGTPAAAADRRLL